MSVRWLSNLGRARFGVALVGVCTTLLVVAADALGWLVELERWTFDMRVRWCQWFVPPATDALVYVQIDDDSLEALGRWPWRRSELAVVIDELRLAGAGPIALDILFPEPQEAQWLRDEAGRFYQVDHDAALAAAIGRHGGVILAADPDLPPIAVLRQAAADVGLVGYEQDGQEAARRRAMVHDDARGRLVHLGLLLAQHMLPDDGSAIATVLAADDGEDGRQGASARGYHARRYVPWFGRTGATGWQTMLDWPEHREAKGFYAIHRIHAIALELRASREALLRTWLDVLAVIDPSAGDRLAEAARLDEAAGTRARLDETAEHLLPELVGYRAAFDDLDEATLDEEERLLLEALDDAIAAAQVYGKLSRYREELIDVFADKAVLIGWAATAAYDEVATPLHSSAPGMIVHGTVFNAAMRGWWWRAAPAWVDVALIVSAGISATVLVTLLGPVPAAAGVAMLGCAVVALAGPVLFDYGNVVVAMAGPLAALTGVWAVGTTLRFTGERLERARITRRFRSYVDPVLVDYVLEHPDRLRLEGEERELTVVFTDLAGFTALSERLRAEIVPLISEYLQRMVPLVRDHRGYVNKFLGDGMMFFYGAPVHNEAHALDAVVTVMRMRQELARFNEVLTGRGLSSLAMRGGIASGPMIVGDAGPIEAADYTVIGDTVNLAARLESANKALGTWALVNARTAELMGDRVVMRPVGRVRVVGKAQGVKVYEPLCLTDEAGADLAEAVRLSERMVEQFERGAFDACMATAAALAVRADSRQLAAVYEAQCRSHLDKPPVEFDGCITLREK